MLRPTALFTGAADPTALGSSATTGQNWTSMAMDTTSTIGNPATSDSGLFDDFDSAFCTLSNLYCLEQRPVTPLVSSVKSALRAGFTACAARDRSASLGSASRERSLPVEA